jgi:ABC-type transport system involved in multi-copper enzyme maturation permease subunit
MTLIPVIARELRCEARNARNHWLRVLVVGLMLLQALNNTMQSWQWQQTVGADGGYLFAMIEITMFWSIWLLAPALTADSISRERREGTLGLLFLTDLRAWEIVAAKSFAHGWRAAMLMLAVLPVIAIPVLMGGVAAQGILICALFNIVSLIWSLAAGMLATVLVKERTRALALAYLLAAAFGMFFLWSINFILTLLGHATGSRSFNLVGDLFQMLWYTPQAQTFGGRSGWQSVMTITAAGSLGVAALAFLLILLLCGILVRRAFADQPPSRLKRWFDEKFCRPIALKETLRSFLRWQLSRNPVGWLEQRTWSGRMVATSWLAIVIGLLTFTLQDPGIIFTGRFLVIMAWGMVASVMGTAAGSFRRERESGVLELLLISPLNERIIMRGRLFGIWFQFMPASVLLLVSWTVLENAWGWRTFEWLWWFVCGMVFVPPIGLYYSLATRTFMGAVVRAAAMAFLIPLVVAWIVPFVFSVWFGPANIILDPDSKLPFFIETFLQGALAVFCWHRLHRRLRDRSFLLERP